MPVGYPVGPPAPKCCPAHAAASNRAERWHADRTCPNRHHGVSTELED